LLIIHSTQSDQTLSFSRLRIDGFSVHIKGRVLAASTDVWGVEEADRPLGFFTQMAAQPRPWVGEMGWRSLEEEFSLVVVCSALGEVGFTVGLRGQMGSCEEWQLTAGLVSEFGQLKSIARHAADFFNP
jgi:hypothetical protein